MKNFFTLCLQLGSFLFAAFAGFSVINWITGWKLGLKGTPAPDDPVSAAAFLIVAGLCYGGLKLLTRNEKKEEPATE